MPGMLDIQEALYLLVQYSIYVAAVTFVGFLLYTGSREVMRSFGWDISIGFRRYEPVHGYPVDWTRVRNVVLDRDAYRCRNCGNSGGLHIHHIVPLSSGGTNNWSNLVTLCHDCHFRLHPHMRD